MSKVNVKTATGLKQRQSLKLGQRQLQGLELLARPIPELRAAIINEIAVNPALEDIDNPLEVSLGEIAQNLEKEESAAMPDYPDEDFTPGINVDEEKLERRQRFFDSVPAEGETLQEHLQMQLEMEDISDEDKSIAEMIIAELDPNGRFVGSIADMVMTKGISEEELEKVRKWVMQLEPKGCGAKNPRECLMAQLGELKDSPQIDIVRRMIDEYFEDIGHGRIEIVVKGLGITQEEYEVALKEMRKLNPFPGSDFASAKDKIEYIKPEVTAVKVDGRWCGVTDQRSLPRLVLSEKILSMLQDKTMDEETRKYLEEKIAAAKNLMEAVEKRQQTLQLIADYIFEHQQAFFEKGVKAMKPLTEKSIAEAIDIHPATVSRAVTGKYVMTKFGPVELRRFFISGVKTAEGEVVAQDAVLAALKEVIENENKKEPLSDEKLSQILKKSGYKVERRTVAKYRDKLAIKGARERKEV